MLFTIVGAGAREYGIASRLVAEGHAVRCVLTKANSRLEQIADRSMRVPRQVGAVAAACRELGGEHVVVQDELLLAGGLRDELTGVGTSVFGASAREARIETDKLVGLEVVRREVPELAPETRVARSTDELVGHLAACPLPLVVRATQTPGTPPWFVDDPGGTATVVAGATEVLDKGGVLLVQPRLEGVPFTIYALTDGDDLSFLPIVQSRAWRHVGDEGPKTGGMGSLALQPSMLPFLTDGDVALARRAITAMLESHEAEHSPYATVLAAEFIQTPDGPRFIEFDCRLGDPELINHLHLLRTPLADVLTMTAPDGGLPELEYRAGASVAVALVPAGYPEDPTPRQVEIPFGEIEDAGLEIFFGNLELRDGQWWAGDSRAAIVAAQAPDLDIARERTNAIARLPFSGIEFRDDIVPAIFRPA